MKTKSKYNIRQNLWYMLKTAWKAKKSVLFLCLLFSLIAVAMELAQLFVAPRILQRIEAHDSVIFLLGTIGFFTLTLLLLNGLKAYLNEVMIFGRINVRMEITMQIGDKAATTSYPNTKDPAVLKLQSLAYEACGGNREPTEHIWETLSTLITHLLCFAIYLILLTNLNPLLMLVSAVTSAISFAVTFRINRWQQSQKDIIAGYNKKMNYIATKSRDFTLAKDIRIFGLAPWLQDIYESVIRLCESYFSHRAALYSWACVLDTVLSVMRNGLAYVFLICKVLDGSLSASEFVLYFGAFTGFTQWVGGIMEDFATLHKESIVISYVQEYLNLPEMFRFDGGKQIPRADAYELQLDHVSFCYPGTEEEILHDLNLTIHPREKLAVVGLNGAGKTTLVKLLCGFYDPTEGCVRLNGTDIREFNRDEYYDLFSAVFQEMSQLDLTVSETVAQRTAEIDMEKVKTCIRKAGLEEKIASFPEGYETHLGKIAYLDGVLLSGGQTQRLMLARALYKDGPILILDEPTAALDPIAENDLYQKYSLMTEGKTSVFISHRLASTRFCDRILFLQNGVIAEQGTHEQLLAMNGGYRKLFEVQARYYQEGSDFREE